MREWLKRLPWKGSDLVRGPRVQIPLLPPMCDKCLKRAIGREIVDIESKLSRLFNKMQANPTEFKHDAAFNSLVDCMATLLKKYENIK